ncbi:phosphate starvation-inducible protein PsiF [Methylovirgula ligni]|uniref:PsiF repeat-containing protein n=1 Tax=Methylovirgula ligni TaxID=569860 RepID=A0A3D9YNW5_9HYPH|nr:PsiF family protein [Methylovirgula ligni]QAY97376.1 phosphate starvation-inducible protein PsiF [Methylovirgula ligni]REF84205.1 psiF repeat-containing protein [Methylovirgula ligni]
MKKLSTFALVAALAGFGVSPVLAQSTTTAPAAKPAVTHSAKSIECSKEADAKGLHGKARKKFRSACKHNKASAM